MEKLILRRAGRTGEEMLLNFGPQHPSTHGVINFLVDTDGEVMKKAIPDIGYLHRGLEKIAELVGYPGFMPYTDRIDYVAAMFANEGYALAVEKLLKLEVPARAQWLRAISCELCRIASHLVSTGTMASDIGATTPLVHALREREAVNDLIEALCGSRLTYNYHRIGGVAFDLPQGWRERVLHFLDHFDTMLVEWDRLITNNTIYIKRLANVAVITKEQAIDYGLVGPNLRGSGLDWDLRRDVPYGAYPNFQFEVPVGRGSRGTVGDTFDRYYVRVLEMMESSSHPAGVRHAARGRDHGQGAAEDQAGGGRGVLPGRVRPRRDGLLPRLRRHREAVPLPRPHRQLHRHGHHRGHLARPDGGGPRRPDRVD